MSAGDQAVTVIRLVRPAGVPGTTPERGVVADVVHGTVRTDTGAGCTYLVVPHNRGAERRATPDIRVGDVVGWIAEPLGVLWVAEQTANETSTAPRASA